MTEPIAAFISPGRDLDRAVDRVRLAERLGYDSVFCTQLLGRDVMMTLGAYAAATERIKLGPGVLPAFPRHPIVTATEAATLDEVSGGRFILGLGMGHAITMNGSYGFAYDRPLTWFKEYVSVVRSLLTTGGVDHQGEFYTARTSFMGLTPRSDLPIYTASLGPRSLEWAGAHADGVILWACLPSYIREVVVPTLRSSAKAAGRDPKAVDIVAAVPCAVAEDVDGARDAFRQQFSMYMTLPFYRRAIDGAGFGNELQAFDEARAAGDQAGALKAMSDAMLGEFAGIGTPETVRAKIADYRTAGVTTPAVGPIGVAKEVGPGADVTLEAAIGTGS